MVYKAGIWLADLHRGLLWTANGRGLQPSTYVAPSWSWAYLGRQVGYHTASLCYPTYMWRIEECKLKATLIECEVTPLYDDTYGKLESGRLDLLGPWAPATQFLDGRDPYLNSSWRDDYKNYGALSEERYPEYDGQIICDFDILPQGADLSRTVFGGISFLQILSKDVQLGEITSSGYYRPLSTVNVTYVQMLAATEQDGVFRRVGRAEIPSAYYSANDAWVMRSIRII